MDFWGRLHRWWYGKQGIIYCPSAIIGEGHFDDPNAKECEWCGMSKSYNDWVVNNWKKRQKDELR